MSTHTHPKVSQVPPPYTDISACSDRHLRSPSSSLCRWWLLARYCKHLAGTGMVYQSQWSPREPSGKVQICSAQTVVLPSCPALLCHPNPSAGVSLSASCFSPLLPRSRPGEPE